MHINHFCQDTLVFYTFSIVISGITIFIDLEIQLYGFSHLIPFVFYTQWAHVTASWQAIQKSKWESNRKKQENKAPFL